MGLETPKCAPYVRHAAEFTHCIARRSVFEVEQVGQLVHAQLRLAFRHILRKHEIEEHLLLCIIAGKDIGTTRACAFRSFQRVLGVGDIVEDVEQV